MAEARMGLADWFDDLSVRFLLNLPKSELESIPRLCFQVEEAQWYYEDFVRPLAASIGQPLPSMHLRQFCLQLFQHCPLLSGFTTEQHLAAYEEFLAYKVRVPVRGAILLDENMERVVLVKGWKKGASWSFPRGKINKDEKDLDCTVREVWEETGFDIRAAGLVPDDERDAKYIDITMREQHMRMFVFRDVPLDTYFEPKTRKEISKIQWYNLRDLPGFARRNRDADSGNQNKFYMVAPFMSHIKKWIGQQRRRDEAVGQTEDQLVAHGLDAQHAIAEEPELYVDEPLPPPDRSEELKRLLSIGGPSPALAQQVPQPPQISQANHLMAMLQGNVPGQQNGAPPQTPLEQVNAYMPAQPDTPQPHHPRQPPMGYQPPPPQFPLSPPRVSQQEQQLNMPFPQPGYGHQYHGTQGPAGQPQPNAFQQQRQDLPAMPPGQSYYHPNGNLAQAQQRPPPPVPQQPQQSSQQRPISGQFQLQGQHGAIAAGPSAPNPSQLPPPTLTAQHMKLLDAFKAGPKAAQPPSNTNAASGRSGSNHQSALLGLFKHSPAPEAAPTPQDPRAEQAIVSPAPDDAVQRPAALQERRPTLNEITRSLPLNFKSKRPSQHSPVIPQQLSAAAPLTQQSPQASPAPAEVQPSYPKAEPQYPPISQPQPPADLPRTRAPSGPKEPKARDVPASSAKQIMQRAGGRQAPGRASRDKTSASPSPGRQPKAKVPEPHVPMTILARPGSAKSSAAGSSQPSFQPQLMKRNDGAEGPTNGHNETNEAAPQDNSSGKRDQLLALFSKTPAASKSPPLDLPAMAAAPPAAAVSPQPPAAANVHNASLLNLFNAAAPTQRPNPQSTSPAPPSAPSLQPTQRPPSSKPKTPVPPPIISHPPQTSLLDLFKKPYQGHVASPSIESPISPFTLNSPHMMRHGPPGSINEQPKSRLGSVTDSGSRRGSGNAASGKGSGGATPTEQKDFLLGFLNGVVQKEGQRK